MSKFDKLWQAVAAEEKDELRWSYDEIEQRGGVPLDHSFLNFKKELLSYGYEVGKISMKEKTVIFRRMKT